MQCEKACSKILPNSESDTISFTNSYGNLILEAKLFEDFYSVFWCTSIGPLEFFEIVFESFLSQSSHIPKPSYDYWIEDIAILTNNRKLGLRKSDYHNISTFLVSKIHRREYIKSARVNTLIGDIEIDFDDKEGGPQLGLLSHLDLYSDIINLINLTSSYNINKPEILLILKFISTNFSVFADEARVPK